MSAYNFGIEKARWSMPWAQAWRVMLKGGWEGYVFPDGHWELLYKHLLEEEIINETRIDGRENSVSDRLESAPEIPATDRKTQAA